jgi:putative FmdB family regulatory protein
MPTYEYECLHCGHRFEELQGISDEPLKECPQCGQEVRRLISAGLGIIFKGSGFYATDNRKGEAKSEKAESNASEKSEKSSQSDSQTTEKKSESSNKENASQSK